jgi:hypothetical protein
MQQALLIEARALIGVEPVEQRGWAQSTPLANESPTATILP